MVMPFPGNPEILARNAFALEPQLGQQGLGRSILAAAGRFDPVKPRSLETEPRIRLFSQLPL